MEFTICAKIEGRVYATIEADSMEEAMEIATHNYIPDWDNEEWISSPTPVNILNNETNEMRDF